MQFVCLISKFKVKIILSESEVEKDGSMLYCSIIYLQITVTNARMYSLKSV